MIPYLQLHLLALLFQFAVLFSLYRLRFIRPLGSAPVGHVLSHGLSNIQNGLNSFLINHGLINQLGSGFAIFRFHVQLNETTLE